MKNNNQKERSKKNNFADLEYESNNDEQTKSGSIKSGIKKYLDPKFFAVIVTVVPVLSFIVFFILNFVIPSVRSENEHLRKTLETYQSENKILQSKNERLEKEYNEKIKPMKDKISELTKSQEEMLVNSKEYIVLLTAQLKERSKKDSLHKRQTDSLRALIKEAQAERRKSLEEKLELLRKVSTDNNSQIQVLNQKLVEAQSERERAKDLFSEFFEPKGKNWYADARLSENYLSLEFKLFKGNQKVYCSYSSKYNLITVEIWTNYYTKIEKAFREKSLFESIKWYYKSGSPKKKSILHLKPKSNIKLARKATPKFIKTEQSISFYFKRK